MKTQKEQSTQTVNNRILRQFLVLDDSKKQRASGIIDPRKVSDIKIKREHQTLLKDELDNRGKQAKIVLLSQASLHYMSTRENLNSQNLKIASAGQGFSYRLNLFAKVFLSGEVTNVSKENHKQKGII